MFLRIPKVPLGIPSVRAGATTPERVEINAESRELRYDTVRVASSCANCECIVKTQHLEIPLRLCGDAEGSQNY